VTLNSLLKVIQGQEFQQSLNMKRVKTELCALCLQREWLSPHRLSVYNTVSINDTQSASRGFSATAELLYWGRRRLRRSDLGSWSWSAGSCIQIDTCRSSCRECRHRSAGSHGRFADTRSLWQLQIRTRTGVILRGTRPWELCSRC